MQITIANNKYNIPASLYDVKLIERIEFDRVHGVKLRDQLKKISEMKDTPARDLEFSDYHFSLACKTLSFFGQIPLDIVEYKTDINDVLTIYHHTMKGYTEDVDFGNQEFELNRCFYWMDEEWEIQPPELKQDSLMSFGEFLQAKQWVKSTWELSEEKWDAMHGLACVYFRKKGEKFSEAFMNEGNERNELMKKLPLEYAIHLGFFFRDSMTSYQNTLRYSSQTVDQDLAKQN